ncbi:MAG: lytic transglycosylase domain-containing protein [bacterium]
MKDFLICLIIFSIFLPCAFGQENTSEPAPAETEISKNQQRMIETIAESERFYNLAIDAYDLGNKANARTYFKRSLKKLASSSIDQNMLYGLSDYFDRIYIELNNRLNLSETPERLLSSLPPIPIEPDNPMTQHYLQLFSRDPMRRSIIRSFERMGLYKDMIVSILKEYGLPEELIYLPVVESRYTINDVSSAGAVGLWQFMRHTGRAYGMRVDFWVDERRDPEKATRAAAEYLKKLYLWFNDWHLALAAYNRGEYGIARDLQFSKTTNFNRLAENNAIPTETEKYVPQFMACVIISQDPILYGIEFELDPPFEYDVYETDVMIDLEVAAKMRRYHAGGYQKT